MTYVEQDCTITHEGKTFEAGGAVVTDDYAVGYVGKPLGDGMGIDKFGPTSRRSLTDWHGNQIGTCYISSQWRVNSYIGSHMCQIYAIINGIHYTGRGFGEGMSWRGKRCANQPKPTMNLPYPFCLGNPTKADCDGVGYCRREYACNN